jgi:hypothetical protein
MQGVCRVGDSITGVCQANVPGHPRPFTGIWTNSSSTVTCNNIAIIRVGDTGITDCGHHIVASSGSGTINADSLTIHRVGDSVIINEGGYGNSVSGSSTISGG